MRNSGNCLLVIAILVVASLLVTLAGCGKKAEDGPEKVLKVGYFPNLTHAQALVGLSDGTFQKALGDEIKIKEYTFNAGPSEIEALLAGEIDIGYIGPVPAINGFVKSRGELSIIARALVFPLWVLKIFPAPLSFNISPLPLGRLRYSKFQPARPGLSSVARTPSTGRPAVTAVRQPSLTS